MDKKKLRTEFLKKRQGFVRQGAHEDLLPSFLDILQKQEWFDEEHIYGAYHPIKGEIDILTLLKGKNIALPCLQEGSWEMVFRQWQTGDPTAFNHFDIPQPLEIAKQIFPQIYFVPLLAFDRTGHRLGYGGGFYDALMKKLRADNQNVLFVGIGYAWQEVEMIPAEESDQLLDAIVTEREVISIS